MALANPRRRRRSSRRSYRRRSYRRNPGFKLPGVGKLGLNFQGALAGVGGMMLARFLSNQAMTMAPQLFAFAGPQHQGKVRGLVTMVLGSMATKALPIPPAWKGPASLGAQIAGAQMALAEIAPAQFGAYDVPVTSALGYYTPPGLGAVAAEWDPVPDATV